jgi:ubiquinol-cytochrome c reductase iron-sulfur subunit
LRRRELLTQVTAAAGGLALGGALVPFVASMLPSERARAFGAPVAFDTKALVPGEIQTVAWRGKPVWILRRTKEMLASLDSDTSLLADPQSQVTSQQPNYARNEARAIRPETFVCVGLCTHLGCIPNFFPRPGSIQPDWPGGFYCPCHGSKFDLAGRVFKDVPAPTNLVIPPYHFAGDASLVVGLSPPNTS